MTVDFGKELARPFGVAEQCFDCAEFYHDCQAWPANKPWTCGDFLRLPDVLPGTCGQPVPPSRMQGRTVPRGLPDTSAPKPIEPAALPKDRPLPPAEPKSRTCGCGTPLPRGKRLCDACRTECRRQT